jgi:hypothetical protein
MQWLTKRFLQLSIHRQVQAGIISVSFSVCLAVLCLLFFNTFLLVNLAYNNIMQALNFKEDQYIENCAMNIDSQVVILSELGKQNVQVLRNFINNNKRNPDFINNLVYMDIPSTGNSMCDYKGNCLNYKILIPEAAVYPRPSFQFQLKIMKHCLSLLDRMYKTRMYNFTAQPVFEEITVIDNVHNAIFFYPNFAIDTSYDIMKFKKTVTVLANIATSNYSPQMISSNMISDPFNLNKTMLTTPFFSALIPITHYELPYNEKNLFQGLMFSYFSPMYKDIGERYNYAQLLNITNVVDIVLGNWRVSTLDYYTQQETIKFKGLSVMSLRNDNSLAINSITCNMFRQLYNFQNNATIPEVPMPKITDCFRYANGNNTFLNTFSITNSTDHLYHERRAKISLINNYLDETSDDDGYMFKIFRYYFPYNTTKISIKSNFYFNINYYAYFFQDQSQMKNKQSFVFYKTTSLVIMTMFYSWTLWYIILVVIGIILVRTTYKISSPINSLIHYVTCSFGESQSAGGPTADKKLTIDNIEFKDDSDINELFQICRSLIKGGFSEEVVLSSGNSNVNAYNNISFVKTNNLIIQEDIIESKTEDANNLFRYKMTDDEQGKLLEEEKKLQTRMPSASISERKRNKKSTLLRKTLVKNNSVLLNEGKEVQIGSNDVDNYFNNNVQSMFSDEFKNENNFLNQSFRKVTNNCLNLKLIKL